MEISEASARQSEAGTQNLRHLAAAWAAFILSFLLLPRIPFGLIAIPLVSLIFQQYLSGVVHEAAHWHFYRSNPRFNDRIGTWGASFVFGYSLNAYRSEHFKHHASTSFLNSGDGETAEYEARSRGEMMKGIARDLFFITAAKMAWFRLSPMFIRSSQATGTKKPDVPFAGIVLLSAILWGGLALAGSFWAVVLFWISFLTLYPLSNRIRVYATHGDVTRADGTFETEVTVNVHSPVYERIFFGNRMLMYHYEHHLKPNLPFREAEKLAWARRASTEQGNDPKINVSSFLYSFWSLLFPSKSGKASG